MVALPNASAVARYVLSRPRPRKGNLDWPVTPVSNGATRFESERGH